VIPIPKPNPIPNPNPNSIPIPNRNANETESLTLNQPTLSLTLAHTKKYPAVIRNYCSTKTTHLQAKNKYTTKANPRIRLQTSDHSFF